jgi:hypothetical protein
MRSPWIYGNAYPFVTPWSSSWNRGAQNVSKAREPKKEDVRKFNKLHAFKRYRSAQVWWLNYSLANLRIDLGKLTVQDPSRILPMVYTQHRSKMNRKWIENESNSIRSERTIPCHVHSLSDLKIILMLRIWSWLNLCLPDSFRIVRDQKD